MSSLKQVTMWQGEDGTLYATQNEAAAAFLGKASQVVGDASKDTITAAIANPASNPDLVEAIANINEAFAAAELTAAPAPIATAPAAGAAPAA